jgi:hypothetical protein
MSPRRKHHHRHVHAGIGLHLRRRFGPASPTHDLSVE